MFSVTYVVARLVCLNNYQGDFQYQAKMVEARHSVAKTAETCRAALCYCFEIAVAAAVNIACGDFHSLSLTSFSVSASTTRDIPYRISLGKSWHI